MPWWQLAAALWAACLVFGSHRVLRFPLLGVFGALAACEVVLLMLLQGAIKVWGAAVRVCRPGRAQGRLLRRLESAATHAEWREAASEVDAHRPDVQRYLSRDEDAYYNAQLLRATLFSLRGARSCGDVPALLQKLGVPGQKFRCGKARVFFASGVLEGLRTRRLEMQAKVAVAIQAAGRGHIARKAARQLRRVREEALQAMLSAA